MAITTTDELLQSLTPPEHLHKESFTGEAAGQLHSSFYLAGRPGAAAVPSPGINGAALTSYAGQIPFPAPAASKNVYLAGIDGATSSGIGALILADRLWHNSGIVVTTTGAQAIATPTWPARDANGATLGVGVLVAIEVSTVTGNGADVTNTTMSYTNSDGTAGRTATITAFPTTAVAGTFVPFLLAAGDVGVRSIQSITLGTSYVSGAIHLVAYRDILTVPIVTSNIATRFGPVESGMPRFYDQSVPWIVYSLITTTGGRFNGRINWAQG